MTGQAPSLAKRLCEAESPFDLQDWRARDGYYVTTCRVSHEDVPDLIDIAGKWSDPDWDGDDFALDTDSEDVEMLPVTAWRTLGDLKAGECVEPLIFVLCELDQNDDWVSDELPHVFGKIGSPAVAPLARLANDADKQEFIREVAAEALHRVAEYHPDTRDEVVAYLAEMMTKADDGQVEFNSVVLVGLVALRAVEAAEDIERAFAEDRVDVGMIGDWEMVRRELGVQGQGLEMPKHPHNSIEQFRMRMGIGVFSDQPVFNEDGCVPDAEQAYYERAWDLFSKSDEAKQVADRFGDLGVFRMFLEFGVNYLGEIVDEMTLASVQQWLLDYVPRKVSTESDRAASIVLELTKFWEYLDRVFKLPQAKSIVQWLKLDGLVTHLEAELSNPANYGMAKSMSMAGKAAGYDMTTEQGMAQFMAAYNQSLQKPDDVQVERVANSSHNPRQPSGTIISDHQRVGRNDPCPCGSGKKFKKCCRGKS